MPVTESFKQFTGELRQRLQAAKSMGMSESTLKQRAEDFGDYLSQHVEPKTPEQYMLRELWQVADQQEQQAIANAIYKLVEREGGNLQ